MSSVTPDYLICLEDGKPGRPRKATAYPADHGYDAP
jgi:predicted transcriptional regulator